MNAFLMLAYIYIYMYRRRQARLFITTGAPIEDVDVEWRWSRVPPKIDAHIGLPGALASATAFRAHFSLEEPDEPGEDDIFALPDPFVPDDKGVMHQLPDKALVSMRMRLERERYHAEWLLPNRRMSPISSMCIDTHTHRQSCMNRGGDDVIFHESCITMVAQDRHTSRYRHLRGR